MSVRNLTVTVRALQDIEDILLFSEQQWGRDGADRYAENLRAALTSLTRFPGIGRNRDDNAPGLLSYPVGEHVVFYRVTDDDVIVRRLVHSRRDLGSVAEE